MRSLIYVALCVWGIAESVCGLMQVAGLRFSNHSLFTLTGHFDNPGPFGGFIAVVCAMAAAYVVRYRKRYKGIYRGSMMAVSVLTLACGLLVLPASMSRAGWFAFAAALLVAVLRERRVRDWVSGHRVAASFCAAAAVALCVGSFFLKRDSAVGRLHIWNMELRAIMADPLDGSGLGNGMGAYGRAQEAYFRENLDDVSPLTVRVAGCPEYPFNEYLGLGMELGAPLMLLCVGLTVLALLYAWRRASIFAPGLAAFAVFACFSYPMSIAEFRWLLLVMLVGGGLAGVKGGTWLAVPYYAVLAAAAAVVLVPWRAAGKDYRSLYASGYALYHEGRHEESNELLERGAEMSSDPMFHVIMGRNLEAMGDVRGAEAEYERAHFMVPCRIYPMVRLMRLYIRQGRNDEALGVARQIERMPLNGKNGSMLRLHKEAMHSLDSLRSL